MRWNLLVLAFMIQSAIFAQDSLIVVSYNVENLFDCQHDTLKDDYSFLPDGMHHWSYYRYYNKLDRIAIYDASLLIYSDCVKGRRNGYKMCI